jgi:hypothetical protein
VVVVGRTVVVVVGGTVVVVVVVVGDGRLVVVVVVVVVDVVVVDEVGVAVGIGGWLPATAGTGSGAVSDPWVIAIWSPDSVGGPAMRPSANRAAVTAPTIAPTASRV